MKIFKYTLAALCAAALLSSCEKDKVTPVQPSAISNISTEPLPGAIKIQWTRNEPITFEYVKVTYFDLLEKKEMMRLASSYSDTILIPNTRAKYGDYTFTLQPFSSTDTPGATVQVIGRSGAAPTVTTIVDAVRLSLQASGLYTDAQEPTEGPIAGLIDGNNNTFFHSAWSVNYGPMPHYIVVDLGKEVSGFRFSYVTRNSAGAGNHPLLMNVYAGNAFDGSTYDVSGLYEVAQLSGLPNGATQTYNSADYILDGAYRYIWFQVRQTHGNTSFFALAELSITELILDIINPEAPAEGD